MRTTQAVAAIVALVPIALALPDQPSILNRNVGGWHPPQLYATASASDDCSSLTTETVTEQALTTVADMTVTSTISTNETTTTLSTETDTETDTVTATTTSYSQVTCTPTQDRRKREAEPTSLPNPNMFMDAVRAVSDYRTTTITLAAPGCGSTTTVSMPLANTSAPSSMSSSTIEPSTTSLSTSESSSSVEEQSSSTISSVYSCPSLATPDPITTTTTSTVAGLTNTETTTSTNTITSTSTTTTTVTTVTTTYSTATATETVLYSTNPSQYNASDNIAVFNEYYGVDFSGSDLDGCDCYDGNDDNTCALYGVNYTCRSFTDCQDICAALNDKYQSQECKGVAYTPQGENNGQTLPHCFPKYAVPGDGADGCGVIHSAYYVDSAGLELQGYPYPNPDRKM